MVNPSEMAFPPLTLPIVPPYPPMEAKTAARIPSGGQWLYEPKWDGFRCLVFRDGDVVALQSKAGQPLTRYFPELVEAALALPLDPRLVCEVRYDHFSGGRFRHGTKFLRWRPDKAPRTCTFDQVTSLP